MACLKSDNEHRFPAMVISWGFSALILGGVWFLVGNVCMFISALTVGGISLLPFLSRGETSRLTRMVYAFFGTVFLGLIVFSGLPFIFRKNPFDIQTLDLFASFVVMIVYIQIAVAQIVCPVQERPMSKPELDE